MIDSVEEAGDVALDDVAISLEGSGDPALAAVQAEVGDTVGVAVFGEPWT